MKTNIFMPFEDHPMSKIEKTINRYLNRYKNKIKPNLLATESKKIEEITKSILDNAYSIYLLLEKDDVDINVFNELSKESENKERDPSWLFEGKLRKCSLRASYYEVAKHNTRHQINLNEKLYGRETTSYLMDVTVSCVLALEEKRDVEINRNSSRVRFDNLPKSSISPSSSPAASCSSTSDASPESEKTKGREL